MAGTVKLKVDSSEFTATLRQYTALSRRTPAKVCNKKAYYIVRRAIWYTHKTEYNKLAAEIGPMAREFRIENGRVIRGRKMWARNWSKEYCPPALALIINWRRGKRKWKGYYGKDMAAAIKKVWGARARSIAYIKSGWITARDKFKELAGGGRGLPPSEGAKVGGPKQIGRPKGRASPAIEGKWKAKAEFVNTATTKRDHKQALFTYGTPALARAFREETESMRQWIEEELRKAARTCGIRTN